MRHQSIPRVVGKWFIPPILLFALYVQFHGDFGPGGGFQAGVIFCRSSSPLHADFWPASRKKNCKTPHH